MQETFASCVRAHARFHWQPGFNDPYAVSWVMVAIYLMTAALALLVARRAPFPHETRARERTFWAVLAIALVFLAVNKQADLQTLLLATGRCLMWTQGWMEERQLVKFVLMIALAISALGGGAVFLWSLRGTLQRSTLPLLGMALTLGFVVFRAAEITNSLGPFRQTLSGNWPDRILEVSGPLTLFVAALVQLKSPAGNRPAPPRPDS